MTTHAVEQFVDRLTAEADLATELEATGLDLAAIDAWLRGHGQTFTAAELSAALLDRHGSELSLDDLDAVAAGTVTLFPIPLVLVRPPGTPGGGSFRGS